MRYLYVIGTDEYHSGNNVSWIGRIGKVDEQAAI